MEWYIQCCSGICEGGDRAKNIVNMIENYIDAEGWIRCNCGGPGYVEKHFDLQEPGETWEPFLRGIIPLGKVGASYQPFVYLVSYEPDGPVSDIWFAYYKDTRATGGILKMGYGPGGPPVLNKKDYMLLTKRLVDLKIITRKQIVKAIG